MIRSFYTIPTNTPNILFNVIPIIIFIILYLSFKLLNKKYIENILLYQCLLNIVFYKNISQK